MAKEELIDAEGGAGGAVMESLGVARRQLATAWLTLSKDQVKANWGDELRRLHRALLETGIRDQLATEMDVAVMQQIMKRLGDRGQLSPGAVLAGMLFFFPHQYGRIVPLDYVPEFLIDAHLRHSLLFPMFIRQNGEADAYHRYQLEWLRYLAEGVKGHLNSQLWRNISNYASQSVNVVTAFFTGANLRDLMRARARIIQQNLMLAGHPLDFKFKPRGDREKIRLGVIATGYRPHTETFATLPAYRHLDRAKFEIILFSLSQSGHPLEKFCASHADQFIALPDDLSQQVRKMREADLDILLIGTNVSAVSSGITLLAAHRLARMQVVNVCSCATTGFRNIDCYLSGKLSEPAAGAQDQYTEKLLMIDGPAHCYDFGTEAVSGVAAPALSRAEMGIEEGAVVFASGANCCKIMPELDEVWASILAATPGSRLLLYPFNPNWTSSYPVRPFMQRMTRCLARHNVSADRLLVFGTAPERTQVFSRLKLADVYLDSYPFAGATSLLDPLELGMPSVVMDGTTFRSLVGPALLRDMKLDEFVAKDRQGYIDLAVKLGTDSAYRAEAKEKFTAAMAAGPRFLNGPWHGGQVAETLMRAWREMRHE